jgi:predicted ribosome quality control (RQC) complex YloA/Tae2 family protein
VANAVREFTAPLESHQWEPSVAWSGGAVVDYAPYVIRQFPDADLRRYDTMSDALVAIGGARRAAKSAPFATLRKPLLEAIESRIDTVRRKRSSLERSLAMADRADSLREAGEAILACASQIQEGDASLTWQGRRIDLYPSLTPVENAQAYFRQYTDARDAKRVVPPLLDEVASELDYLEDMALHVEGSENEREISAIRRELEEANVIPRSRPQKRAVAPKGKQQPQGPAGVVRKLSIDGAELLVGGSAEGNETVTFRLARPEDLWFHARGRPGSHVILRTKSGTIPDAWIERAAEIAAKHSAGQEDTRVEVDYTLRKHVRKIAGALPGRVSYRNETTVTVSPGSEAETRRQRKTV